MNIALPFCTREIPMVNRLIGRFRTTVSFSERSMTPIHVFSAVKAERELVVATLQRDGFKAFAHDIPDFASGWPKAPNAVFRFVVAEMEKYNDYWYFMEPDHCPVRRDWITAMATEYELDMKQCNTGKEPIVGTAQVCVMPGAFGPQQIKHVNGAAIYPNNTHARFGSELAWTPDELAWDVFMAMNHPKWFEASFSYSGIHLAWRAENPRLTTTGIEYDSPHTHVPGVKTIGPDVVMIHGFKDPKIFELTEPKKPEEAGVIFKPSALPRKAKLTPEPEKEPVSKKKPCKARATTAKVAA